eukprot:m.53968 g.53968  ORF g.53968 m.53968 type:complete len:58 (+) comp12831_c0_seq2:500-673(+)
MVLHPPPRLPSALMMLDNDLAARLHVVLVDTVEHVMRADGDLTSVDGNTAAIHKTEA